MRDSGELLMKTGKCPKCKSNHIRTVKGGTHRSYALVAHFSRVRFTDYICVDCGYCENYVDDPKDREKIKSKGSEISGRGGH